MILPELRQLVRGHRLVALAQQHAPSRVLSGLLGHVGQRQVKESLLFAVGNQLLHVPRRDTKEEELTLFKGRPRLVEVEDVHSWVRDPRGRGAQLRAQRFRSPALEPHGPDAHLVHQRKERRLLGRPPKRRLQLDAGLLADMELRRLGVHGVRLVGPAQVLLPRRAWRRHPAGRPPGAPHHSALPHRRVRLVALGVRHHHRHPCRVRGARRHAVHKGAAEEGLCIVEDHLGVRLDLQVPEPEPAHGHSAVGAKHHLHSNVLSCILGQREVLRRKGLVRAGARVSIEGHAAVSVGLRVGLPNARVAERDHGGLVLVVVATLRLQHQNLLAILMLILSDVVIYVQSHLHAIPAANLATLLGLLEEATVHRLQIPPGFEAQGDVCGLWERHDRGAQALRREVGVEAVLAGGPGLARALGIQLEAVILVPNRSLLSTRERLPLRVDIHLHDEDLALALEGRLFARPQLPHFCWLRAGACGQHLGPHLPVRVLVQRHRAVRRRGQAVDAGAPVVQWKALVLRGALVGPEARETGAIPEGPVAELLGHGIPGVFGTEVFGQTLHGPGHPKVQQDLAEGVLHTLHIQLELFEDLGLRLPHVLEVVVIGVPPEG
mmetsp:Transcript_852/g.1967  ORF Transcript_852/g.1967 Transcript_852/m.1967 type:complete len:606 (-) Transcript_852:1197-3014(-)